MQPKNVSINAVIMSFMLSCLVFGFMAVSVAAAATGGTQSGDWVKKDYSIKGEWTLEKRGDQHVISFNDKFKTKKGPDLKIFLSKQSIDEVTGKTATNDAVLVSVLQKNKGSQEYVLPDNVDVSDFKSLLIHCEAFSVLWGGTNLHSS